jgi:hypothetical protein
VRMPKGSGSGGGNDCSVISNGGAGGRGLGVALLVGDGGAGKSRFARELAARMRPVKVGISLLDTTHARAVEHARTVGTTLSGLVDAALKAERIRRELADHMVMLSASGSVG